MTPYAVLFYSETDIVLNIKVINCDIRVLSRLCIFYRARYGMPGYYGLRFLKFQRRPLFPCFAFYELESVFYGRIFYRFYIRNVKSAKI